jgi:hypothetical protein
MQKGGEGRETYTYVTAILGVALVICYMQAYKYHCAILNSS